MLHNLRLDSTCHYEYKLLKSCRNYCRCSVLFRENKFESHCFARHLFVGVASN